MAITFDPSTYRIILDSASVTAAQIFSRWEDWAATSDNAKYGMVIRQVGSDDLGSGLSIPPYFFLQGAWRVRPMEADHDLVITGNLFVEGGGVPVVRTLGPYQVNVNYTVPVQAQAFSATGSGASAADVWAYLLDGTHTPQEVLLLLAAVAAGKTTITPGTGNEADVAFRNLNDTKDAVIAHMVGSERASVSLDP